MSHPRAFFSSSTRRTPRRYQKKLLFLALIMSGFCLLVFGWTMGALVVTARSLLDGKESLDVARFSIERLDFSTATGNLSRAQESFLYARRALRSIAYLTVIPPVREPFGQLEGWVEVGYDVLNPLQTVVDIGSELENLTNLPTVYQTNLTRDLSLSSYIRDLSSEKKQLLLARLSQAAGELETTVARMDLLLSDLHRLSDQSGQGSWISTTGAQLLPTLQHVRTTLDRLFVVAKFVPVFAGEGISRHFLLLFLNNQELRPGGGFIGTYGILEMHNGDIVRLETHDSYNLDRSIEALIQKNPPAPLTQYGGLSKWFFRDANWSPDFAASAQQSLALFYAEAEFLRQHGTPLFSPLTFDGVIGMTPTVISSLLSLTGPLSVDGQRFTAENFSDLLEFQVEKGYVASGLPPAQRKEILADLVRELHDRVLDLPLSSFQDLFSLFEEARRTKQLAFYQSDQSTEEALSARGLAGRIQPKTVDTLLFVDANLSSLKTDPVVQRSIAYTLAQDPQGEFVATATMTYNHTGSFNWKTTRYRSYARLYVPEGSVLLEASGALQNDRLLDPGQHPGTVDLGNDLGFTTFGAFISIEPGKQGILRFTYRLPPTVREAIEKGEYALTVFKQLGSSSNPLTLDLDFGRSLKSAVPPEQEEAWGDSRYGLQTVLDQDRTVDVVLR